MTWNKAWSQYIPEHLDASAEEFLAYLRYLYREFGKESMI